MADDNKNKTKPKKGKALPTASRAPSHTKAARGQAGARTMARPPPPRGGR